MGNRKRTRVDTRPRSKGVCSRYGRMLDSPAQRPAHILRMALFFYFP